MTTLAELIANKKKQLQAGNRARAAKIPDGTSRWRILPTWRTDGSDQFWHDFGAHYIKDGAGEMKAVYVCVDKTFGKPCDICDAVRAAAKSATDDATIKLMKEAGAAARILVNAVHLDGTTPNDVQVTDFPPTAFEQVLNIIQEWLDAGDSPLDVTKGKDFIITRTGKGIGTKYSVQVAAKTTKLPADILKKLHNLDEYVAQESAEQAARALNSVRAVAGLLTAPSRAGGIAPSKLAAPEKATTIIEEDEYAVATPPAKVTKAIKPEVFEDVPDTFTPAAAVPAEEESTGDPELDALMKTLG